ncbi:MAG: helix-turn-helix domain-containing protein [Bacilli bacterium]
MMNLEIASRLVKLRKAKGLSQEDLADKLGISRQAISKWERAEASPDTDNLILLARLYEVSLDELLSTDDKDEEIKAEVVDRMIKEEEKQEEEEQKEHHNLMVNIINSSYVLIVVLAYLLIGFLIPGDGFGKGWIIFLTIPIVFSLVKCITHRNANLFAFPVLMAFVYVGIGMIWGIWHPTWLVFILIPIYYSITSAIVSTKRYKKK